VLKTATEKMDFNFDTKATLQAFLGHYMESIKEELDDDEPDDMTLACDFLELLDSTFTRVSQTEASVLHIENPPGCNCFDFLSENLQEIITFERDVSQFLGRNALIDEKGCWITQMIYKYKVLYHILRRQEQDYIDGATC